MQWINPAFDDSRVVARHLFNAACAQEVIPCDYPKMISQFATPVPGLKNS